MRPTFSYWDATDLTKIASFTAAWKPILPGHHILNDAEVIALIRRHFPKHPEYVESYATLGIASAKSDIARHLALYDRGGFYLDVHFGYSDPEHAAAFLTLTNQYDATLVDVAPAFSTKPTGFIRVIAGLLGCAKGHPLIQDTASRALQNVTRVRMLERAVGFQPYDLFHLTGPGLVNQVFFDHPYQLGATTPPRLKLSAGNAHIFAEAEIPLVRNVFKSAYTRPGNHWSERQKREPLFPASGPAAG